jgi:hypothetical protein
MEKIYELEALFTGIESGNSQIGLNDVLRMAYLEISCNACCCLLRQKQRASLFLDVEADTFLQVFLKYDGKSLASFSIKVLMLCEKRLTGDFSKRFRFSYKKSQFFVNFSGSLTIFKQRDQVKNSEYKGVVKDFQDLIGNRKEVINFLKESRKQLENEFGVKFEERPESGLLFIDCQKTEEKSFDFKEKKSYSSKISQDARENSSVLQESSLISMKNPLFLQTSFFSEKVDSSENLENFENSFQDLNEKYEKLSLCKIIISLQTQLKDLKNDSFIVQEIESCLAELDADLEPLPTQEPEQFENFKKSLIQENNDSLKELAKNESDIKNIEKEIESLRINCERMQKEIDQEKNLYKLSEIQQEISELSEKFVKSQEECFFLSDSLKKLFQSASSLPCTTEKSSLLSKKYDLLESLQKKSTSLDSLNQEIQISSLNLLKSPKILQKPFNLDKSRESFNSLCTESARLVYNSALSIKSLENICNDLKYEVETCKKKVTEKDKEFENLRVTCSNLQKANNSTTKLIEKDLKETTDFLSDFLENSVNSHDILMNELDYLSNLTLLQTTTWVKERTLQRSLESRLAEINEI